MTNIKDAEEFLTLQSLHGLFVFRKIERLKRLERFELESRTPVSNLAHPARTVAATRRSNLEGFQGLAGEEFAESELLFDQPLLEQISIEGFEVGLVRT